MFLTSVAVLAFASGAPAAVPAVPAHAATPGCVAASAGRPAPCPVAGAAPVRVVATAARVCNPHPGKDPSCVHRRTQDVAATQLAARAVAAPATALEH